MEHGISLMEARGRFPFIRELAECSSVDLRVFVTPLDAEFRARTAVDLEDHTIHSGSEDWHLFVVDKEGVLSEVKMRFGKQVIAAVDTHWTSDDPDPMYDSFEEGETVGEALARNVMPTPDYAVLYGQIRPRFDGGPFRTATVASRAEAIRQLAYALWEKRGRPVDNDPLADWLDAERLFEV